MKLNMVLLLLILNCVVCGQSYGAGAEEADQENLFEMSIEDLMNVPLVITASRQEQSVFESSVAVSVITAEEIHLSGLTTIPDILQLAPGVDVRRLDRHRYAVGVRGLHGVLSDRTLVLINGRAAANPVFSGTDWLNLPVLIEDISRIEIVRGPGGAAWGANAATGVINIITKKPEDVLGGFVSTTISEFGDSYTHVRYGGMSDLWKWRVSAGYEDIKNSDDAGAGDFRAGNAAIGPVIGIGTYKSRDFSRNWKFDSEFEYSYSDDTKVLFGAAYSYGESGDYEFVGYFPRRDYLASLTRLFARVDHDFDDGSTGYLQWYGNLWSAHAPNMTEMYRYYENDVEGQYNFEPFDDHKVSVGGNLRWTHIRTENDTTANETVFRGGEFDEYWAGLFVIDRYEVTDRLTLEGQLRGDWYSETDIDWSARASAIYALDDRKDHIVRASFARAFRAPTVGFRRTTSTTVGGLFNTLMPTEDLRNEETWSLEAGYAGRLAEDVTLRVDSYYQRIEDLIGVTIATAGPVTNSTFANTEGATSYGVETEIAFEKEWGKVSAWYAYNDFELDRTGQIIRAMLPSKHKVGAKGQVRLAERIMFNANYTYNNAIEADVNPMTSPGTFHKLDLTLSRKFADGNGEFMIGIADVLNKTNDAVLGIADLAGHETPGRTLFARVQWLF